MGKGFSTTVEAGQESQNVSYSVETEELKDKDGNIVEISTHGGKKTTQDTFYLLGEELAVNEALNAQAGDSVVTDYSVEETGTGYAKVSRTTVEKQ